MNLLYKRAESARGERTMHEQTLRVAAALLDSNEELRVIAGAKWLGGLIETSPLHAQTAADLLCARLRRQFDTSIDVNELGDYGDSATPAYEADQRMRNAVASSIAAATHRDGLASHVVDIGWNFADVDFGTRTIFDGCVFGERTTFVRTRFGADVSFRGARFLGNVAFDDVHAPWGLNLRDLRAEVGLDIFQTDIGELVDGSSRGLDHGSAELGWLTIDHVRGLAPINLDDVRVVGDLRVTNSSASYLSLVEGHCDRSVVISRVETSDYLCVRDLDVRKDVSVFHCKVAGELEVTAVRTDGSNRIHGNNAKSTKIDL